MPLPRVFLIVVLLGLLGFASCGPGGAGRASAVADQAQAAMLVELSRLAGADFADDGRPSALCFAVSVGSAPGFDPLEWDEALPEHLAPVLAADPRFVVSSRCSADGAESVLGPAGSRAHLLWVDSVTIAAAKVWGTVIVGLSLGESRGYVCSIIQGDSASLGLNNCQVAWFS